MVSDKTLDEVYEETIRHLNNDEKVFSRFTRDNLKHAYQSLKSLFGDSGKFDIDRVKGIVGKLSVGYVKPADKGYRRALNLMCDVASGCYVPGKIYTIRRKKFPKSKAFIELIHDYQKWMTSERFAQETKNFRESSAVNFLLFLEGKGIAGLSSVSRMTIKEYQESDRFKCRKLNGRVAELIRFRLFLVYLEEQNLVSDRLSASVMVETNPKRGIVTTLTKSQKEIVLKEHKGFLAEKRDRAIHCLALYCGLRIGDILNLKFDDIDWSHRVIRIRQHKTDNELVMPMCNEVCNSLVDYILHERRKCDFPYIFIPYTGIVRKLQRGAARTYSIFRKEDDKPKQYGTHIMRRTFASDLLKTGSAMPVISASLGHSDPNTANKYLATDERNMREIALPIDALPEFDPEEAFSRE
jgi:integrase/recombinase XerD